MASSVATSRVATGGKSDVLARIPFFLEAPRELQAAITEASSVVRLESGEFFLQEGDSCENFAIVVSGRMRVYKVAESGHEITLYHVGAGEACPLNVSCILSDRPVPAMARVEEDVEAVVIPAATFRLWMAKHESIRTFVFRMFANRLTEVMSLVEEVAFRRMDHRLASRLIEMFANSGRQEAVDITHAEIAAELGTAREVVSRLLKEFERLGAISLARGRISLRDAKRLEGIAGDSPAG